MYIAADETLAERRKRTINRLFRNARHDQKDTELSEDGSTLIPMGQPLMALQRQTAGSCRQLLAYLAITGPAEARTWLWYMAVVADARAHLQRLPCKMKCHALS